MEDKQSEPRVEGHDVTLNDEPKPQVEEHNATLDDGPKPQVEESSATLDAESKPQAEEYNATLDDGPKSQVDEHNATLDDEPKHVMDADALQESILEDSDLNAFQKFCARMDDKRWKLAQRVVGALLGVAAGLALFWEVIFPPKSGSHGMFSVPLIVAIVIALIVPNIIEKQGGRRAPQLRVAMVIALALVLVIYMAVTLLTRSA